MKALLTLLMKIDSIENVSNMEYSIESDEGENSN